MVAVFWIKKVSLEGIKMWRVNNIIFFHHVPFRYSIFFFIVSNVYSKVFFCSFCLTFILMRQSHAFLLSLFLLLSALLLCTLPTINKIWSPWKASIPQPCGHATKSRHEQQWHTHIYTQWLNQSTVSVPVFNSLSVLLGQLWLEW